MIELLFLICMPFDYTDCDWDFNYYMETWDADGNSYYEDRASIGVYYDAKHVRFSPDAFSYNERALDITNMTIWQNAMLMIKDGTLQGASCTNCKVEVSRMSFEYWWGTDKNYILASQEVTGLR